MASISYKTAYIARELIEKVLDDVEKYDEEITPEEESNLLKALAKIEKILDDGRRDTIPSGESDLSSD